MKKVVVGTARQEQQSDNEAEFARVSRLTDAEVLAQTDNGRMGAGIVGIHLAERAARVVQASGGGAFGPAIIDPDYAEKQLALKEAAKKGPGPAIQNQREGDEGDDDDREVPDGPVDPTNLDDPRNPWTYVTGSGAKLLAQQKGVSYKPRSKRAEIIALLQAAEVEPPPVPKEVLASLGDEVNEEIPPVEKATGEQGDEPPVE